MSETAEIVEGYERWAENYLRRTRYRPIGATPLRIEPLPGAKYVRLAGDFQTHSRLAGPIRIPAGFVSDLASIPRLFWRILPRFGPWCEAAVVHDWLCRHGGIARPLADRVFLELLRRARVRAVPRGLLYAGARIGASRAYLRIERLLGGADEWNGAAGSGR